MQHREEIRIVMIPLQNIQGKDKVVQTHYLQPTRLGSPGSGLK